MDEDFSFNASALLGCLIGAATGYRQGNLMMALDWCYVGFAAGVVCAAVIAEAGYAIAPYNMRGARLLERVTPLISLAVLVSLAVVVRP